MQDRFSVEEEAKEMHLGWLLFPLQKWLKDRKEPSTGSNSVSFLISCSILPLPWTKSPLAVQHGVPLINPE